MRDARGRDAVRGKLLPQRCTDLRLRLMACPYDGLTRTLARNTNQKHQPAKTTGRRLSCTDTADPGTLNAVTN
ncbi:MAG: hypothetical protein ABGZ23_30880 [Fuerstiella sp.]